MSSYVYIICQHISKESEEKQRDDSNDANDGHRESSATRGNVALVLQSGNCGSVIAFSQSFPLCSYHA